MDRDLPLADRIDALLPQTQCRKCGFSGCRPYAEAIAAGAVPINRCPPGGAAGIARLAALLGQTPLPLDPAHGVERPLAVAVIDESLCIGCTLCIQACPVDAIVGAARRMHTVLPSLCTGCDLCVAPCPMDCIRMQPVRPPRTWTDADAQAARARFQRRGQRLSAERAAREARLVEVRSGRCDPPLQADPHAAQRTLIGAAVQAAIERARARRRAAAAPTRQAAPDGPGCPTQDCPR